MHSKSYGFQDETFGGGKRVKYHGLAVEWSFSPESHLIHNNGNDGQDFVAVSVPMMFLVVLY